MDATATAILAASGHPAKIRIVGGEEDCPRRRARYLPTESQSYVCTLAYRASNRRISLI
jgi:hypothetical protein